MDNAMTNGVFSLNNTIAPNHNRVLPLFSLKGKTAIVSGAGAGIGLAVAQAYAEAGANVVIWYNANKKAIDKAAEIEKEYGVKCESLSSGFTQFTTSGDVIAISAVSIAWLICSIVTFCVISSLWFDLISYWSTKLTSIQARPTK